MGGPQAPHYWHKDDEANENHDAEPRATPIEDAFARLIERDGLARVSRADTDGYTDTEAHGG